MNCKSFGIKVYKYIMKSDKIEDFKTFWSNLKFQ